MVFVSILDLKKIGDFHENHFRGVKCVKLKKMSKKLSKDDFLNLFSAICEIAFKQGFDAGLKSSAL